MAFSTDGIELLVRAAKPANAFEETVERLLQSIRLGLIEPGERLPPERELATMLKVSRDTVRDAIATLADSGYVLSRRGRYGGTFVVDALPAPEPNTLAQVGSDELEDVATLRRVLEVGAAREAAGRDLTAHDRVSLTAALDECLAADDSNHRRLDSRLHLLIAELAGSPSLVRQVADLRTRVNRQLDGIPMLSPNLTHSNEQHASIVAAILSGDADAAAAHMLEHVDGSTALLRGFLAGSV